MSLPRYPEYKDSGVEWLGEVPAHWRVGSMRRFLRGIEQGWSPECLSRAADPGEWGVLKSGCVNRGVFNEAENKALPDALSPVEDYEVRPGDVLMSRASGSPDLVGSTAFVHATRAKLMLSDKVFRVRLGVDVSPRFFVAALNSRALRAQIERAISGAEGLANNLPQSALRTFALPVPPVPEQSDIVAYLDRETAKIDALVAEQERLVELLKEKRQAVISHAVNKGLNPHAPMKDSGIKWLGDVPRHWTLSLLKRTFRSVEYGISDALKPDGAVAVLRMGNIVDGAVDLNDLKYTDAVEPSLLLSPRDLLFNRTNSLELIGKVGMFRGAGGRPVTFASYLVRLRTIPQVEPEYMAYLLNTEAVLCIGRTSAFVAIGQCNLNPTRYGQLVVATPPLTEQSAIVAHLDHETARLDTLTLEAQHAIDLLQERRTALISAAVTGQIDVRGVGA